MWAHDETYITPTMARDRVECEGDGPVVYEHTLWLSVPDRHSTNRRQFGAPLQPWPRVWRPHMQALGSRLPAPDSTKAGIVLSDRQLANQM